MQENRSSLFRKVTTFVVVYSLLLFSVPARAELPPLSNAQLYTLATRGNVYALRAAIQRGLNIDSLDRNGNTALCHAVIQRNYTAYNTLRAAGANPNHPCMQRIAYGSRESFLASKRVVPTTANSRQAYTYIDEDDSFWSTGMWITTGVVLLGGIVALILSGSSGGGGDIETYETTDYNLAGIVGTNRPDYPQDYPYNPILLLEQNGNTIVNGYYPDYNLGGDAQEGWVISNEASINVVGEDGAEVSTPLTDLIDFNTSALKYSDYIQVAMKATYGSTVNNGYAQDDPMYDVDRHYLITLNDNTTALAAFKDSFANNYSQININAKNGTIGIIGSVNSSVANQIEGQINMTFMGDKDNHAIMGMYVDSNSTALNEGTIYGQAQSANSIAGTLIGMRGQLLNQENPRTSQTYVKNRGIVKLEASANNRDIKTSLVGLGSWIEDKFLNGTMYLSRAGYIYLENQGSVILNVALTGENGTYSAFADNGTSYLLNGTGGIVGMRADGNTIATNDGLVQINIEDDGTNTVTNNHAGMQSVHGGKIVNNNTIEINGGSGGYGMLAVRGEGNNPEFDAIAQDVSTVMINNGNIIVNSEDSYAMVSYTGGSSTNTGTITFNKEGVAIQQNTGVIANRADIIMNAGGIGLSMTQKGDIINDLYNTDNSMGAIYINNTLSNEDAEASDAKESIGIFLEDGTVLNKGTIEMVNTQGATGNISYGIKANKGDITSTNSISVSDTYNSYGISVNEGSIDNSGTVSLLNTTGVLDNLGYALKNGNGTINNTASLLIVNKDNAYAISSGNGNVTNEGQISISSNVGTSTTLAYGINSNQGAINNSGVISIENANDSYGISAQAGNISNSASISLTMNNGAIGNSGYGISSGQGDISNTGTVSIVNQNEAYAITANNGNVTNEAALTLNGNNSVLSALGYGIKSARGSVTNKGNIVITNTTDGYGISADNGDIINNGSLNMYNSSGSLEGLGYGLKTAKGNITNTASVSIQNKNQAYALYSDSGAISNSGELTLAGNSGASTDAYGIKSVNGAVANNADITITDTQNSYAVSADNGDIKNTGDISLSNTGNALEEIGYGLQGGKSHITNSGSITIENKNNAYAISNTNGFITNNGVLTINGDNTSLSATAYGIQAGSGLVTNNESITITNTTDSYAVWNENGNIMNTGAISLYNSSGALEGIGYGLKAVKGEINNSAAISIKNKTEAYAISGDSGTITNSGELTISGNSGASQTAYGIQSTNGSINNDANVSITNTTDSYALWTDNGDITNSGLISLTDSSGALGGIGYGLQTAYGLINNTGAVTITNKNEAYGLVSVSGDITNDALLTITGNSGKISATAYGIQAGSGLVTNKQGITISNVTDSYAVWSDNGNIVNSGDINLFNSTGTLEGIGYGLSATKGDITNTATISIQNKNEAYAISNASGAVTNSGELTLSGNSGASQTAYGIKSSNGAVDNIANVTITNTQDSYALWNDNGDLTNSGLINIYNTTGALEGIGYGLYTSNGSLTNTAAISIKNKTEAYAISNASGSISNSGELTISGNSGASQTAYGIQSTSGDVENTAAITITDTTDSYAISADDGDISNSGLINISSTTGALQGIGYGLKTGVGNITSNGAISLSNQTEAYGISTTQGNIDSNSTINITNSTGAAANIAYGIKGGVGYINSNEEISITNANEGYGISADNGIVTNNANITLTNTQQAQNKTSYGIKAEKGSVINNANIYMNVTGDLTADDETNIGSYGIWGNEANITNSENSEIVFSTRGHGMYTASGSNDNYGVIEMNKGGVGMGTDSGNATNHTSGTITIDDTGIGMNSGNGSAVNDGQINITGTMSSGMESSKNAINNGTILITGYNSAGMSVVAENASIVNNSEIIINTSHNGLYNYGMYGASGVYSRMANNGTITITGRQYPTTENIAYGMYLEEGEAQNAGSIVLNDIFGYGMYLSTGGTLDNYGSISLNYGGVGMGANGASSDSNETTAMINHTDATITTSGQYSYGMKAEGVATAWNDGTLTIGGEDSYGIYTTDGSGTNTNVITMSDANSVGMHSVNADSINKSTGVITIEGENSVGMQTQNGGTSSTSLNGSVNEGTINLEETATSSVGMTVVDGNGKVKNKGTINVQSTTSVGMLANGDGGTVDNSGNISVTGENSYGMQATQGTATNNATITISSNGSIGMFADGGNIVNGANGNIVLEDGNTSTYAMYVESGTADNQGTISLTKDDVVGIFAESGTATNSNTINLSGDNTVAMRGRGDAQLINAAGKNYEVTYDNLANFSTTSGIIISGNNSIGMEAGGSSTATNSANGVITVNGADSKGMVALGVTLGNDTTYGTAVNQGIIIVNDASSEAMYADGGVIVNDTTGMLYTNGDYGMNVNSGSGTNKGYIRSDDGNFTAMYVQAGSIDNQGRITLNGDNSMGMVTNGSATADNSLSTSLIEVNGSNSIGMQAIKGTATNSGQINVNATDDTSVAMQADGGVIINASTGDLSSSAVGGVVMLVNAGSGENQGTIVLDTDSITAMRAVNGSIVNSNEITMSGPNSTGMEVINGTAQNDGKITIGSNGSGAYAMAVNGNGSATNDGEIVVDAADAYAMYTNGGTIINNSGATITTNGSSAMYVESGTFENNGDITNSNNNFHAIHIENGTGINTGTIELSGNSAVAIYADQSENLQTSGDLDLSGNSAIGVYLGSGNLTSSSDINMGSGSDTYAIQGGSSITISSSGDIKGSGTGVTGIGASQGNITNTGNITLSGNNATGINLASGGVDNSGTLSVKAGSGTVGMQTVSGTLNNLESGTIDVVGTSSIGMYASGTGSLNNKGVIIASGEGSVGMLGNGGAINNNTSLTVSGVNAVGISNNGGTISNGEAGTIDVDGTSAVGLKITGGGQAFNNGSLTVQGQFGMYAAGNSTITNDGTITLENGSAAMRALDTSWAYNKGTIILVDGGEWGICDNPGHCVNNGNIVTRTSAAAGTQSGSGIQTTSYSLATMSLSRSMAIGLNGNYTASQISGDLAVDGSALMEGNDLQYTLSNALTAADVSDLNVRGTAWFNQVSVEESSDAVDTNRIDQLIGGSSSSENASTATAETDQEVQNSSLIASPMLAAAPLTLSASLTVAETEDESNTSVASENGLDNSSEIQTEQPKTEENGSETENQTPSLASNKDSLKNYNIVVGKGQLSEILDKEEGIQDSTLLAQIDSAYEDGKDGQYFDSLKYAPTNDALADAVKNEFGLAFFNNFAKQNLDIIKSVNRQLNAAIFNNNQEKDVRFMAGYDYTSRQQDADAYMDDYEDRAHSIYAMADKKVSDTVRVGLGALLTKYDSEYNDSSASRNEVIVQMLAPLTYSPDKSFKLVSVPRIGFGFGDYTRTVDSGTYDGDTKNFYYGITNEARKIVDFGWMAFEPTLEFNVLGIHQNKIDESGALEVDASDSISIEGGVGFYASKLFEFGEAHKLKFRAGGTFYHELGDPFKAQRARMRDADIYYRLNGYDASRNRGVVSVRMDYDYKNNLNIYGEFNKFIEDNDAYSINAGMGYRF